MNFSYRIADCDLHLFSMPVIGSNMYVVVRDAAALVIDPCVSPKAEKLLAEHHVARCDILLTHEHFDHISGVNRLRELYSCRVICSESCAERISDPRKNAAATFQALFLGHNAQDQERAALCADPSYHCSADLVYRGKMQLDWQGISLELSEAPGHSPGSQLIWGSCGNFVFTGDSLIPGVPVITRLPGGSRPVYLEKTLPQLRTIPTEGIVLPGHGNPAPFRKAICKDRELARTKE